MTVYLTVIDFPACINLRSAVLIYEFHISIIYIFIFSVYSLYTTSQSKIEYGKKWDREEKHTGPVYSLGYVNFTEVFFFFFQTNNFIEHLRLIESWFPDRSASFLLSVVKRNLTVTITIFCRCLL